MLQKRVLLDADITAISHEGRGIAKLNGKTTFIHNALPHETVKFHYTRKQRSFDQGQADEIISASPQRVTAFCPHYYFCGGCSLQHWQRQQQITHKQNILAEQLHHFAQTSPKTWLAPIVGHDRNYRHKARLGVRFVAGKESVLVGFRERNGRYLTDMQSCDILHPAVGEKIADLRHFFSQLSIPQAIAQIEVAIGDQNAALIIRHLEPFTSDDLSALKKFAQQHNFHIYLQPGKPDTIHKLFPQDQEQRLTMRLEDHQVTLSFHPSDFTQINPEINRKMINQMLHLLAIEKNERVLDLFSGIGNFALPLARYCHNVTAVEGSEEMVRRGQENSQNNDIHNIQFYSADLNDNLDAQPWAQQQYDKIVIDPPRSGALELVKQIKHFNARRIVYISCHPASLARDTAILLSQGYELRQAGIMDMFPHTSHIEAMALFCKMES